MFVKWRWICWESRQYKSSLDIQYTCTSENSHSLFFLWVSFPDGPVWHFDVGNKLKAVYLKVKMVLYPHITAVFWTSPYVFYRSWKVIFYFQSDCLKIIYKFGKHLFSLPHNLEQGSSTRGSGPLRGPRRFSRGFTKSKRLFVDIWICPYVSVLRVILRIICNFRLYSFKQAIISFML